MPSNESSQISSILSTSIPDQELSSANFPNVRYWSKSQRRTATELAKGTIDLSKSHDVVRGKKAVAQGQNNACMYIENENGQPVDGYRLSSIRQLARVVWVKFAEMGMAPVSWGKANLMLANEYKSEMRHRFPEFRLCENDWKLQQLATTDYPSCHLNYFGDTLDSKKKRPLFQVHDKSTEDPSTKNRRWNQRPRMNYLPTILHRAAQIPE